MSDEENKKLLSDAVKSRIDELNIALIFAAKAGLTVEMTEYNLQTYNASAPCVSFSAKVYETKTF